MISSDRPSTLWDHGTYMPEVDAGLSEVDHGIANRLVPLLFMFLFAGRLRTQSTCLCLVYGTRLVWAFLFTKGRTAVW